MEYRGKPPHSGWPLPISPNCNNGPLQTCPPNAALFYHQELLSCDTEFLPSVCHILDLQTTRISEYFLSHSSDKQFKE